MKHVYSRIAKSLRPLLCIAALVSGTSLSLSPLAAQNTGSASTLDSARVIVKFKANASLLQKQVQSSKTNETIFEAKARSNAEQLGNRLGMRLTAGRLLTERTQVLQADGMSSEQLVQRLSKEADIEFVVVDQLRKTNAAPI